MRLWGRGLYSIMHSIALYIFASMEIDDVSTFFCTIWLHHKWLGFSDNTQRCRWSWTKENEACCSVWFCSDQHFTKGLNISLIWFWFYSKSCGQRLGCFSILNILRSLNASNRGCYFPNEVAIHYGFCIWFLIRVGIMIGLMDLNSFYQMKASDFIKYL